MSQPTIQAEYEEELKVLTNMHFKKSSSTAQEDESLIQEEIKLLLRLVEQGADINTPDQYGLNTTLLDCVSFIGDLDSVKKSVSLGANLNEAGSNGCPCLFWSLSSEIEPVEKTKFLIESGADINAKTDDHEPFFFHVIFHGNKELFDYVINKGIDIHCVDSIQNTALHWSVAHKPSFIKTLAECGIDINAKNPRGNTPLMMSAELMKDIEVIKTLLQYNSDFSIRNNNNETVIDILNSLRVKRPDISELIKSEIEKRESIASLEREDEVSGFFR